MFKTDEEVAILDHLTRTLEQRGVRLAIGACGCCDGPWVRVQIDGGELSPIVERANIGPQAWLMYTEVTP
jgi:hypothetical protein